MSSVPAAYRDMLRAALSGEKIPQPGNPEGDQPVRKRKRPGQRTVLSPVQRQREIKKQATKLKSNEDDTIVISDGGAGDEPKYVIHLDDDEDDTPKVRNGNKDVVDVVEIDDEENSQDEKGDDSEESDEDIDSDEFEDVDLEGTQLDDGDGEESGMMDETEDGEINITIRQHRNALKRQRATVVDSEERVFRRKLHMMHLFIMLGHGTRRNKLLSDPDLLQLLQRQIPAKIKREVQEYTAHRAKSNVTAQSKTRRLLDLLRHLMEFWQGVWSVDARAPVLYKKSWNEISSNKTSGQRNQVMNNLRFRKAMIDHVGSRDIAAQGFVALLRSINLPARLVFSIQPPDFTNMKKSDVIELPKHDDNDTKEVKSHIKSPAKGIRAGDKLLTMLRGKKAYTNKAIKTDAQKAGEFAERYGGWPVFWAEVWDKDSKKYITVDPMVKKLIEVVTWKSKLEPPMNCPRNNAWYVVGYDRVGGIRDITRRYCKEYNAKGRKKRITREPRGEKWWNSCLRGACSKQRLNDNRVDKFEQIEFEELGLKEGMPLNVGDFKGHPIYVLESDLKFNEILMPKISCGGLANKGKSKKAKDGFIPVYKRSNVCVVRSARGWFMRGRVLKIGERPLKVREKKKKATKRGREDDFELSDGDNVDEEEDARLYAESQTELYKPPPIVNGIIPKNAFKNIDIYEQWMIPEGCVHVRNKYAEKAAKLMGVEYASAVVGFDFKGRRDVSAKIDGIVTFEEYGEAVAMICEGLKDMEIKEEEMREDLINLRAWSLLLTKLKINKRLRLDHGDIEEEESDDESEEEEEEFESGGFMVGRGAASTRTRSHFRDESEDVVIDEDINARSDLSASDFESDAEIGGGGFEVADTNISIEPESTPESKADISKSESKVPVPADRDGDDEEELVYNPDTGFDYYDSSEEVSDIGNESEVNGSSDIDEYKPDKDHDDRLDQLDADFAEFEKQLNE